MNPKQPNDPRAKAEDLPENTKINQLQTPDTTEDQLPAMKRFLDLLLQEVEKDSKAKNSKNPI